MAGPWAPPQPGQYPADIEFIRGLVGKHFPIYETRINYDTVSLYCTVDKQRLEKDFDDLRREMRNHNYVPILAYERGDHVIHVLRNPPVKGTSPWVNVAFFFVTVATTIVAGAQLWYGYSGGSGSMWTAEMLGMGFLTFALPLLVTLGAHELSHYFAAKRHGVAASMPFFIPSFPPLGTFGAFISIREPIPSRKALLDIGAAGPIASFVLAIPLTIVGLMLTGSNPGNEIVNAGGSEYIGSSAFFDILMQFMPIPGNRVIHPLAFAGWVGLFVTAINLLPAGQLDGGHIARALLGDYAHWASYAAMGLLVFLGIFLYFGWLIFAGLIFFLGMRHPPPLNDVTKLGQDRRIIGAGLAIVLVLCFVPVPMGNIAYENDFVYTEDVPMSLETKVGISSVELTANTTPVASQATYSVFVVNTGNTRMSVSLRWAINTTMIRDGWDCLLSANESIGNLERLNVTLDSRHNSTLNITVIIPPGFTGEVDFLIQGEGHMYDPEKKAFVSTVSAQKDLSIHINVQ